MSDQPKTERGRASRARIVASADELIAQNGVAGTSLEEILSAAGASKSQMYHYFSDRQDLVHAVVDRRCQHALADIVHSLDQVDSLHSLEAWLKAQVAQQRRVGFVGGCPIGSLGSELADRDEGARTRLSAALDTWERSLEAALRRIQERGELRPDASPPTLAAALLANAEGGLLISQIRKSGKPLRAALHASLAYLRSFATSS